MIYKLLFSKFYICIYKIYYQNLCIQVKYNFLNSHFFQVYLLSLYLIVSLYQIKSIPTYCNANKT